MEGLTTAKLAKEGGVNVETIRYYERHGLLPRAPGTPSGYRKFSADYVIRLRFIRHAQELGFIGPSAHSRSDFGIMCRTYGDGGGVPSEELLRGAVVEATTIVLP